MRRSQDGLVEETLGFLRKGARILDSGILDTYCQEGSVWEQSSWLFGFGLGKKGEAERLKFRVLARSV